MPVFPQPLAPIGGSVALSALIAAIPLALLFVLLGVFKIKAWLAAIIGLVVSLLIAIVGWTMPAATAFSAAAEGAFYGAFPIMWILVNAIWVYQLSVITGWFESLGQLIRSISDDQRILAILIAFCFGALMEALAGFGAPVAISAAMLMAAGMKPLKAAVVSLLANTAPVAFGAMGTPITALASVTGIDIHVLSQMAGRQTPFVAAIVPLVLVLLVDGRRGVRQAWPVAVVAGVTFGAAQFVTSNFITVEITDVVASLVTIAVVLVMLRFWKPANPLPLDHAVVPDEEAEALKSGRLAHYPESTATGARRIWGAIAPYAIIIVIFSISQIPGVKNWLLGVGQMKFPWPGLSAPGADGKLASTILNSAGRPVSTIFTLDHLRATGTLLLIAGIVTACAYRVKVMDAMQAYLTTLKQLKFTIVTVLSVLALAYVMNLSGQTASLGFALASVGSLFALMSPLLGWVGVAITGSDTSANSLFGLLQVTAAEQAGLNPVLMAASNSSGGVMGKMVSPQNLAVAAAAVGMMNREGDIFRKVVLWSLGLLAYFTVLVVLQAGPLAWMVPVVP